MQNSRESPQNSDNNAARRQRGGGGGGGGGGNFRGGGGGGGGGGVGVGRGGDNRGRQNARGGGSFPKVNTDKEIKDQEEIYAKATKLQEEISSLSKLAREKREANKAHKDEKDKINKLISEIEEKKRTLEEEKANLDDRIKTLRNHQRNELIRARSKLPINRSSGRKDNKGEDDAELINLNYKEINEKISNLEKSISTSKSLLQDKRVISDLHGLRNQRAIVREFEIKLGELTNETVIKQLNEQLKVKIQEMKNLRAELNVHYAKIKELNGLLSANYNEANKCTTEKQKIQPEVDKLWTEYEKIKETINEKRKKHAQDQQEHYRKIKEEKEKRAEQKKKWEEEKQKAIEEQTPYEDEIAQCDKLLGDLEDITKLDKRSKKGKNEVLKLSLHTYNLFEMLSLVVPRSIADVEKAKSDVQSKKDHFIHLQKVENEKRGAKNAVKTEVNGEGTSDTSAASTEHAETKVESKEEAHSPESKNDESDSSSGHSVGQNSEPSTNVVESEELSHPTNDKPEQSSVTNEQEE